MSTKTYTLQLFALNCLAWTGKSDVKKVVRELVSRKLVILAKPRLVPLPSGDLAFVPYEGYADSLIDMVYKVREVDEESAQLLDVLGPERTRFQVLTGIKRPEGTEDWSRAINLLLSFQMYTRRYSEVTATCVLGADGTPYREKVVQLLLEIGRVIYRSLKPAYSFVDAAPSFSRLQGEPILARQLEAICWANFFGLPYVECYGKDFLMKAPAWKAEELEDGGVFLQLGPEFTDPAQGVSREETARYFKPAGVRYVQWPPAPGDHD